MARLVREELGKCYYREGVNHLEKCGALRGKLSCVGVRRWKSRPWNCLVMATKRGFGDPLVIYRRLIALVLQNGTLSC
jgi:hypothetical protein